MPFTASDICKIILAVLLPPLGVFLERGCGADFLINILLTCLGYIPGINAVRTLKVNEQYLDRPTLQSSLFMINDRQDPTPIPLVHLTNSPALAPASSSHLSSFRNLARIIRIQ
ncbi:hypothetical protein HYFRA_00000550 [Hymenoscyphus fraxineus]|uniref:Plasma membrane proteolipid 3 n=1 Tax=Hymenoscyphus fraxineus TaxID=746836 RepID=A0A9N9L4Z0_9HELO|nr:hypothetical protein HYFRA_00000550 [Hymenoscyphus fraxineus]